MSDHSEYIQKHKNDAVKATQGTGLFPSVMIAQAIVEGNAGKSELASRYNNHFGIKADSSWTGKKVNLDTREVIDGKDNMQGAYFRVYPSAHASYKDRVEYLLKNKRYRDAGVFDSKTPLDQLKALQKAGYATDPRYAEIINSVVEHDNLGILDTIKRHPGKTALAALGIAMTITGIIIYIKS